MTRYAQSHKWLAGAIAVAFAAAIFGAACGSSSKLASNRPASGATASGGTTGRNTVNSQNIPKSTGDSGAAARLQPSNGAITDTGELAAAPAADGTSSGPSGAPNALPSTFDRKIIQTATLTISTDNVSGKFEDVRTVATTYGGFVASSTFGNSGDKQTAAITIRVPGDAYERALNDLRKLGDVKGEQSGANDVTEEFTDLQSRLRNLQATEAQYVQFLLRATSIQDVLTVQDRLNATRGEIEQVQGRLNLVQHQTDLATITVHLDPPVIAKVDKPKTNSTSGPLEVAGDSFRASIAVLLGIATVLLAVAAFSWWMIPLAVVGIVIARKQFRTTNDRRTMPPPSAPAA